LQKQRDALARQLAHVASKISSGIIPEPAELAVPEHIAAAAEASAAPEVETPCVCQVKKGRTDSTALHLPCYNLMRMSSGLVYEADMRAAPYWCHLRLCLKPAGGCVRQGGEWQGLEPPSLLWHRPCVPRPL
jgi:hypothetical protein